MPSAGITSTYEIGHGGQRGVPWRATAAFPALRWKHFLGIWKSFQQGHWQECTPRRGVVLLNSSLGFFLILSTSFSVLKHSGLKGVLGARLLILGQGVSSQALGSPLRGRMAALAKALLSVCQEGPAREGPPQFCCGPKRKPR